MKICQAVLKFWSGHENCNTQRAITPTVGKPELQFICSARRLMVFNMCVKFHENMSSSFKLMEWESKLLTHKGQLLQKEENQSYRSCVLHAVSWCLTFV